MKPTEIQQNLNNLNQEIEEQKKEITEIKNKMIMKNYLVKISRIGTFEYIGTLICYVCASYLITKFPQIESIYIQVLDVICVLLLFTIPVLSQKSVRTMKTVKKLNRNDLDISEIYSGKKTRFQKFQKINLVLSFILMICILPVLAGIKGIEMEEINNLWAVIIPIGTLFFAGLSYWVLTCYKKTLRSAKNTLLV